MTKPFIEHKAGDFITAQDWNEIQSKIRELINAHTHDGADDHGANLTLDVIKDWQQTKAEITEFLKQHSHNGKEGQGAVLKKDAFDKKLFDQPLDNIKTRAISKIAPMYIRGSGLNHNANRLLIIGGEKVYETAGRGLTLTIISKTDFSVVSTKNYDTYGKKPDADLLAKDLNGMKNDKIGILTSYDAWEGKVSPNLKTAFNRIGLYKALGTSGGSRRPYAAIFESSSLATLNTAKAVEVLYSDHKGQPFAEIRGWLIDGSFMATGTIPNALGDNLGSRPAILVNEGGNVDIQGTITRKMAVATGLGPNDGIDKGQVKSRVLKFNKIHDDTAIRILYCDNLRVNGNNVAARWEIRVDSKAPPGGAIYQDKYGNTGNYHGPSTIVGYATGLNTGSHVIGIWIGTVPGNVQADAYTGWNTSRWTIEAEEVWI